MTTYRPLHELSVPTHPNHHEVPMPHHPRAVGLTAQPDREPELISGLIAAHDLAHGPTAVAVQVQLERTLRAAGVERIHVTAGQPFDPDLERSVGTEPTEDAGLTGCVAREVRPGWVLGSRVLRAVDVVVWTG